jgi:hypothetical protein
MKLPPTLSASMLLVPASLFGASTPLTDFKIEVDLTNTSGTRASFPVRCLGGCDWDEMVIECAGGEAVCHATIEARIHADALPPRETEVRPISGTVCLGLAMTSVDVAASMGLRAGTTTSEKGTVVARVIESSPADLAGFEPGDLVRTFNSVPVNEAADGYFAIQSMAPGQPFEATVDRNGALVHMRGSLGMSTTANTCAPADSRLLQVPAVTLEELTPPFELVMDAPNWKVNAWCLRGCAWTEAGLSQFGPGVVERSIVMDQNELRPREVR